MKDKNDLKDKYYANNREKILLALKNKRENETELEKQIRLKKRREYQKNKYKRVKKEFLNGIQFENQNMYNRRLNIFQKIGKYIFINMKNLYEELKNKVKNE